MPRSADPSHTYVQIDPRDVLKNSTKDKELEMSATWDIRALEVKRGKILASERSVNRFRGKLAV